MSKRHRRRGLESKHQPLATREEFALRLGRSFAVASLLIALSLFGGMAGYHYFEGLPWIDALPWMLTMAACPSPSLTVRTGPPFCNCCTS